MRGCSIGASPPWVSGPPSAPLVPSGLELIHSTHRKASITKRNIKHIFKQCRATHKHAAFRHVADFSASVDPSCTNRRHADDSNKRTTIVPLSVISVDHCRWLLDAFHISHGFFLGDSVCG